MQKHSTFKKAWKVKIDENHYCRKPGPQTLHTAPPCGEHEHRCLKLWASINRSRVDRCSIWKCLWLLVWFQHVFFFLMNRSMPEILWLCVGNIKVQLEDTTYSLSATLYIDFTSVHLFYTCTIQNAMEISN